MKVGSFLLYEKRHSKIGARIVFGRQEGAVSVFGWAARVYFAQYDKLSCMLGSVLYKGCESSFFCGFIRICLAAKYLLDIHPVVRVLHRNWAASAPPGRSGFRGRALGLCGDVFVCL